jgi:hypothetical protein
MKKNRTFIFGLISAFLIFIILELTGRLALFVMKYPFWQPSKVFYAEIDSVQNTAISQSDEYFDILILGGSAISMNFGIHINKNLDSLLNLSPNHPKIRRFTVATPAHTSLDNLNKYSLLKDKRFDLVIFYEAINENRTNNIPPESFSDDYQHVSWYYDMAIMEQHPEVNWTVLPYLVHKSVNLLVDKIKGKQFLELNSISPDYVKYGAEIRSAKPYRNNIEQIIQESKKRNEKLLLMTYALYIPSSIVGNGGYADYRDFAGCQYPSPHHLWGDPVNVRKGVDMHNTILKELAAKNHVLLLDMDKEMPRQKDYYCDICHLTEPGSKIFAQKMFQFITEKGLLKPIEERK